MGVRDESGGGHRKVAYGLSGATGIVHCLCSKMPMKKKKILVTIQEFRAMLKDPAGSCDQCYHHRDYQERPPSPKASWTLRGPQLHDFGLV